MPNRALWATATGGPASSWPARPRRRRWRSRQAARCPRPEAGSAASAGDSGKPPCGPVRPPSAGSPAPPESPGTPRNLVHHPPDELAHHRIGARADAREHAGAPLLHLRDHPVEHRCRTRCRSRVNNSGPVSTCQSLFSTWSGPPSMNWICIRWGIGVRHDGDLIDAALAGQVAQDRRDRGHRAVNGGVSPVGVKLGGQCPGSPCRRGPRCRPDGNGVCARPASAGRPPGGGRMSRTPAGPQLVRVGQEHAGAHAPA
jgi:hypothetical protein